jgi:hypothetical protein
VRFKPFFEPLYDQSLYKSYVNEILVKLLYNNEKTTELNSDKTNDNNSDTFNYNRESSDIASSSLSASELVLSGQNDKTFRRSDLNANNNNKKNENIFKEMHKNKNKHNILYEQMCLKMGIDVASTGQMEICFKLCDKLPETLYSLNYNTLTNSPSNMVNLNNNNSTASDNLPSGSSSTANLNMAKSFSANQLTIPVNTNNTQIQEKLDTCFIYLTISIDSLSMIDLMRKQICKEHWPLYELDLQKNHPNTTMTNTNNAQATASPCQALGFQLTEIFLVNRLEVVVQKILPNTPASLVLNLKQYDIIHTFNQVRITSIKQLNKLIQKTPIGKSMKFQFQRPCIQLSKKVQTSSSSTTNTTTTNTTTTNTTTTTILLKKQSDDNLNHSSQPINIDTSTYHAAVPSVPSAGSISSSGGGGGLAATARSKLEQIKNFRLDPKIKLPFGNSSPANALLLAPAYYHNNNQEIDPSNFSPNTQNASSSNLTLQSAQKSTPLNTPTNNNNLVQAQPSQQNLGVQSNNLITHTASSSNLVDFFCSAAECSTVRNFWVFNFLFEFGSNFLG